MTDFNLPAGVTISKPSQVAYPELILLYGPPGGGKGLVYGTPVYTPKGRVAVEDLQVGDAIIGSNGKPTRLYGYWDRGVLPVYKVTFNDGASVTVDADHLWTVQTSKGTWITIQTRDIIERLGKRGYKGLKIPTVAPVEFAGTDLPLPPYMLGALIADGYLSGEQIQWTKFEVNVVDEFVHHAAAGISVKGGEYGHWRLDHKVKDTIRAMGLNVKSAEKFIPEEYLRASVEDRWALVHGLFDGDGSIRKERASAYYHTTSETLAHDVVQLLWSLGVSAKVGERARPDGTWAVHVYSGHEVFRASENAGKNTKGVRSARTIVSITPEGSAPVRCIAVEAADQLYVTKDYIVTHNTYLGASASELPHVKKMLIIDTEGSASGTLTDFSDDKIDIVRVTTHEEFSNVMNAVFDADDAGTLPYDVVQVDTFDVAQDRAIKFFQAKNPTDGFAAWGAVKEWSEIVAHGLKSIKPLGILVLHDREEKSKSGSITARLRLSGSARDTLPGIPDVVAYVTRDLTDEDEELSVAQFASQDGLVTKNRFKFPPAVEDPNIPALFKYIDERKSAKKGGK